MVAERTTDWQFGRLNLIGSLVDYFLFFFLIGRLADYFIGRLFFDWSIGQLVNRSTETDWPIGRLVD